jgi:hypothetical protein
MLAEAERQRQEDGGDLPLPEKKFTTDAPDMFNTQGSVFDEPNDGEVNEPSALYRAKRGQQAPGKDVPTSIDAIANVASAFEFAAGKTFRTNRDFKLALQDRILRAAKALKLDVWSFSAKTEDYLVRMVLADARQGLKSNSNAVGWYNEKVTKALRILALIHPELATNRKARFAFTWALAVTSNGMKVDANFKLAEAAYDRVAFVNGEQSADRYKLSNQINYVQWNPGYKPGVRLVTLEDKSGQEIGISVDPDGTVYDSSIDGAEGKKLDVVLGKDLATKIMEDENGSLRGLDLNIGGEGMKAFYDKIVPNNLKDVLRKVGGGALEMVAIPDPKGIGRTMPGGRNPMTGGMFPEIKIADEPPLPQPGFTITPAMREKAANGLPLFSTTGRSVPLVIEKRVGRALVQDQVDQLLKPFAHKPEVVILDTAVGVLPGATAVSGVAGAVHGGRIYLFLDQLSSRLDVQQTLFHELLHYRFRRFMTKGEFVAEMHKLYQRDDMVRQQADAWVKTAIGQETAAKFGQDYATARGVDEALALLAQPNGGAYLKTDPWNRFVVTVTRWLADLTQRLGAKWYAARLRGMKNEEARKVIQNVFGQLRSDALATDAGKSFGADPAIRLASAQTLSTVTETIKTLIGLERTAFNLDSTDEHAAKQFIEAMLYARQRAASR